MLRSNSEMPSSAADVAVNPVQPQYEHGCSLSPRSTTHARDAVRRYILEVHRLHREGVVLADGELWQVKFYGFGDAKVISEVQGLSTAAAHFACPFCERHKLDRAEGGDAAGVRKLIQMHRGTTSMQI